MHFFKSYFFSSNKLCNPLILNCLHVFCEGCLEKLPVNESSDALSFNRLIVCPTCKQETKVNFFQRSIIFL